jgi:hypothetical protein
MKNIIFFGFSEITFINSKFFHNQRLNKTRTSRKAPLTLTYRENNISFHFRILAL